MSMNPGVQLAKEILRIERKLDMMIQNNELNFDVYEEDGKGVIVTARCNVGGCSAGTSEYGSLKEAQRQAALWTLDGEQTYIGEFAQNVETHQLVLIFAQIAR